MPRPPAHLCHATGCKVPVPPKMLMCAPHWRQVPTPLQKLVWATYEPGQEVRKDPSSDYLRAAQDAIDAVAGRAVREKKPGRVWFMVSDATGTVVSHLRTSSNVEPHPWPGHHVDPDPGRDRITVYRVWLQT